MIDKYFNINLIFDVGTNDERRGTVVNISQRLDGRSIGHSHTNPFFDTHGYEREFIDGTQYKYDANIITENMYAQVDNKGYQFQLLAEIQDHRKDRTAISKEEGKIRSSNATERDKITTRGWEVMAMWKDGSTDWIQFKDINGSKPDEVAEYVVANHI